MSVPDAAISFLVENISQVINENYHSLADSRNNLLELQQQLVNLKGLMVDFSRYNVDSDYVRGLVKEMRSITFEAEDTVDTFILRAAVQRARNWLDKFFHQITDYPLQLLDLGKEMKKISERVRSFNQEAARNGIEVLQYQAVMNLNQLADNSSREAPRVEEEHVVGFDGATQAVQELLTKGAEGLEVISIVGMLGLGKTTLARKVLKDPIVDYEFMNPGFVYVSREYKKKEVLLQILESTKGEINDEVNKMGEEELGKHLYKHLEGKQYLVVLDDVWEEDDWDRFKGVFPKNNKRCRVLITTRHEHVATHANKTIGPYKLDFLPDDKSQELLKWRVFNEDKCPKELEENLIKIAKKCDGLPLAIVVIAGIIVNEPHSPEWWGKVADSVKDYIARDTTQTAKLIEVMYKHLPNWLKLCFLYLGVFREDLEIPVWKLLRLWIAEGLIKKEGDLNIEDLAEQHLRELVQRNLVMVVQKRSNGKIKTCRMHDTLREFCKTEATKENLFQEIRKENLASFLSGDATLELHRRLCINNINVLDYISGKPSGKRIRSFLTFVKEETKVEPKFVSCIPSTFKLLRVLEIESLTFTRLPADLPNLVLLKYIAISSTFKSLPQSFSALWNLQTLILNTTSPTLDIKVDIWKMPQFRHLHTNASTNLPSPGTDGGDLQINEGRNVQTLSTISPESCRKEVLERTPNVKKLGIRGKITSLFGGSGESNLFGYLRTLKKLENLKLLNDDLNSQFGDLPLDRSFPKQLTSLTLLNTFLEWEDMSKLGKLENLEVLKAKDHAFQGVRWVTEKGGFQRLKHLHIGRTDLVKWETSGDHFPELRSLKLIGCNELEAFPHGLADIPGLQSVILHSTNRNVASTARRLHVLKLELEKKGNTTISFKLSIYPPDH